MTGAILIADDYADDAEAMKLAIRDAGISNPVVIVSDGDEAIAYLKGDGKFADRHNYPTPGVLFIDLQMQRVDGLELLEWLKTQPSLKALLVVVLNGNHGIREISHAFALGAHSVVFRGCGMEYLLNLAKRFAGYWTFSSAELPAEASVPAPRFQ